MFGLANRQRQPAPLTAASSNLQKNGCPGFGWDRVNYQKELTQTCQTGYSIPRTTSRSLYNWGSRPGREIAAREPAGHRVASETALCIPHFVHSFHQYYCCYFPLPLLFSQTVFIPTHEFSLFLLILLPIPLRGEEERVSERPRGPAGAEPRQRCAQNWHCSCVGSVQLKLHQVPPQTFSRDI